MFGYFSHGIIRKHVIVFGSMFNDITIERKNAGTRVQTLAVPIAYGPKQKFLVRLEADPNLDREIAMSLPRLGFELAGITYDPSRKLNSTQKNSYVFSDKTLLRTQYTPVPYNIDFILSIMVKNADDGTQILEQILPYFKPEWNISVNLIPEMKIAMDVPTILNSVSLQDTYDGDFQTRRALIWDLNFTMKGYLYGPVSSQGIITRTSSNFYADTTLGTEKSSQLVLVPGLQSDGTSTANSAASIHRDLIDADDDYGFAANTFFFG
tara:strand:- start:584 stop:1381 length:798 start_codon:yes stop_codon:yes gene_type:complete